MPGSGSFADVPFRPSDPALPHVRRRAAGPPPRPPGSPRADVPSGDVLSRAAADLDEALAGGPPGDPVMVFLPAPAPASAPAPAPSAAAAPPLGWVDLGDVDLHDALLGFVAPDDWWAVGVAVSGSVVGDAGPGHGRGRPRRHRAASRVRVTALVARDGRAVSVVRRGSQAETLDEPPSGLVGDSLRRALGLPTPPPPETTTGYWVALWLDRVVASAVATPGRPGGPSEPRGPGGPAVARTWPAVAALHPAWPEACAPTPAALAAATARLASRWPWPRLRFHLPATLAALSATRAPGDASVGGAAAPVDGPDEVLPGLPTRAVAAWMDDGMFARAVDGMLPLAADLFDACAHLLPPGALTQLAATIEATFVPGDAGGDVPGPLPEGGHR